MLMHDVSDIGYRALQCVELSYLKARLKILACTWHPDPNFGAKAYLKHTPSLPQTYPELTKKIPKTYPTLIQHLPNTCPKHTNNIPRIYTRQTQHIQKHAVIICKQIRNITRTYSNHTQHMFKTCNTCSSHFQVIRANSTGSSCVPDT